MSRSGFIVTIIEIDQHGFAHVRDAFGKMHRVNATITRAKGMRPRVGEAWVVSRDLDRRELTLAAIMGESVEPPRVTGSRTSGAALLSLLDALEELGVIINDTTQ